MSVSRERKEVSKEPHESRVTQGCEVQREVAWPKAEARGRCHRFLATGSRRRLDKPARKGKEEEMMKRLCVPLLVRLWR